MSKSLAEINKAIASIATKGKALDALIQETGVDVVVHFAQHKDTGLVNRLYLALPSGSRKTAMASWLLAYVAVSANTDKDTKATSPFKYDSTKATKPEAAAEDMWFNHKPDKPVDMVFDLQQAVRSILSKASKASSVAHGDVATLKLLAHAVGIAESDVPTSVKTVKSSAEALAAVGDATH